MIKKELIVPTGTITNPFKTDKMGANGNHRAESGNQKQVPLDSTTRMNLGRRDAHTKLLILDIIHKPLYSLERVNSLFHLNFNSLIVSVLNSNISMGHKKLKSFKTKSNFGTPEFTDGTLICRRKPYNLHTTHNSQLTFLIV